MEEDITRSGLRSSDISSERRRVHFNNDRNRDDRQFSRNNSRPSTDQSARSSTTFPTDKRRPAANSVRAVDQLNAVYTEDDDHRAPETLRSSVSLNPTVSRSASDPAEPTPEPAARSTAHEIVTVRAPSNATLSVSGISLHVPVTIDDGADFSVMGCNFSPQFSSFICSQNQFEFRVANDSFSTCSGFVLFDVHLPTGAGDVIVRRHQIYVADIEMSQVLLGRPFLHRLGIDVESQIRSCAFLSNDHHVSDNVEDDIDDEFASNTVSSKENSDSDVLDALNVQILECSKNGAPESFISALRDLLFEFSDIFRVSLRPDDPVVVTPLLLQQKSDAVPVLAKCRSMPPAARTYMRSWISELEKCGFIFFNRNPTWALPAFVVDPFRKPRMVIDMVIANKSMVKYSFPMPHLQSFSSYLKNSSVYFTLDCFKGYWKFPVSGDLDCQSFVTPFGVYTPTRICQGNCNGVFAFQRGMSEIFGDLIPSNLLIWLDDVLGFSSDPNSLLILLRSVFVRCRKFRLKLSALKCCFFLKEALWCGNVYSARGVSHDPKRIEALINISLPRTASDLMQFICAATWLSSSILDFSRLVSPLRNLLENCLSGSSVRTKKFASRISLSDVGWSHEHSSAFYALIDAIKHTVTVSFPTDDLVPCLFTDASKDFWMVVITQVPFDDLVLPF